MSDQWLEAFNRLPLEEQAKAARHMIVYGNVFIKENVVVEPVIVLLHEDGTYSIKKETADE